MNYDLKISVEELSMLKSALFDYKQKLDDHIISAEHLAKNSDTDEEKEIYERLIRSKEETKFEIICLMGKLQNIIPVANKITNADTSILAKRKYKLR